MKTSRLIYISFLTTLLFGIGGIAVKADTIDSVEPKIEKVTVQQNQTMTLTDDDVSIKDGIITGCKLIPETTFKRGYNE